MPTIPELAAVSSASSPLPAFRRRVVGLAATAWRHPFIRAFCAILLAIDLLCIGFYAITRTLRARDIDIGVFARPEFRITAEHGYPEWFGYLKLALVILLVARIARFTRQPVYLALTLLFGLVLLDDSLALHEALGQRFVQYWSLTPAWGVAAQPQGELLAWAVLGGVSLPLLAGALYRSRRVDREVGAALLLPVIAIGVFAVGVDALYGPFKDAFMGAGMVIDTLEDGGELVSITAACALASAASVARGAPS